jgi:hypothetical protein
MFNAELTVKIPSGLDVSSSLKHEPAFRAGLKN